jgi:hypothetical protein
VKIAALYDGLRASEGMVGVADVDRPLNVTDPSFAHALPDACEIQ